MGNETYFNLNDEVIRVGVNLFRVGPLIFYLKFATAIFVKLLMAPQSGFRERSATYQRLTLRIVVICSVLLSMLIWLVETEFMGFFLKYVLKSPPTLWIFPPKFISESFVALKLFCLNLIISKYENITEDAASDVAAGLFLGSFELSRIEDMVLEFFDNCELGRCGYLLLNPLREQTEKMLSLFHLFVNGHDIKRIVEKSQPRKLSLPERAITLDDLQMSKKYRYKTLNSKRSHSANCIFDFKQITGHS